MAAPRKPRTATSTKAETAPDPHEDGPDYNIVVSRTDSDRPFVVSNRFSVANAEVRGRELLALAPINHVGPAPILVPMAELDELIEVLTQLRAQPGPGDPNDA